MTLDAFFATALSPSAFASIALLLTLIALAAAIEFVIPLHPRNRWNSAHLLPNFALSAIYLAVNLFFTAAIVLALAALQQAGFGLFNALALDPLLELAFAVLILDFQAYGVHVAMHESRAMWRFHRVHHTDPAVDVTTALRQHPGESVIRFLSIAVFAAASGASPEAFALYRLLSGVQALSEHANVRLPLRLDTALSWLIATPNYHKVHHSRARGETDTNYANILTVWDRLFLTATPAHRGRSVSYGLDGFDDRESQTARALLALPFRTT